MSAARRSHRFAAAALVLCTTIMATERVIVAAPSVDAGNRVIASPFQFWVTGEDNLRLSVANSLAGVVVRIDGRFLDDKSTIRAFSHTFTPTSNRVMTSQLFPLGSGFVLNLTVFASSGAPRIGQTFVKVDIVRGLSGATIALGTMLQGYVTSKQGLGWPGSPITSSLDGGGFQRAISGTLPAAGSPVVETCPTGARWQLIYISTRLVAGAAVANRLPYCYVQPSASGFGYYVAFPEVITASGARYMYWASGSPYVALVANQTTINLPQPVVMLAGGYVMVAADNMQAADQFTVNAYSVLEWLEVE